MRSVNGIWQLLDCERTDFSGFSELTYQYLGETCKGLGVKSIAVNLLKPGFSVEIPCTKELELSTNALREKFHELLVVENIRISEIQIAHATFYFLVGRWPTSCYIEAVTLEGKRIEVAVDSSGKTAEILHASS